MKTIVATTLLSLTAIGTALCQNVGAEFNKTGDLTFMAPGLPAIPFVCMATDYSTGKNVGAEKLVKGTKDDPQPPPNGSTFKFGDEALKLSVTPTINGKTCDMLVKWDTSANRPGCWEQKIVLPEELVGDLTVEVDGVAMTQTSTDAVNLNDGDKIALCGYWVEGLPPLFAPGYGGTPGYAGLVGVELRNRGIRNSPMVDGLDRMKTEAMLAGLDNVIAAAPAYVVLANLGADGQNIYTTPHPPEAYIKNVGEILAKLKAAKIKTIIATSYAKYSDKTGAMDGPNKNIAEYNDVIREAAQKYGATLIDFTKILDESEKTIPMDASPEAAAWVNQLFAGELLRVLGYSDKDVDACRKAWQVKGGSKITAKRTSSGKVLFEITGEFPRVQVGTNERPAVTGKEIVLQQENLGAGKGLLDLPESRWQIKFQ